MPAVPVEECEGIEVTRLGRRVYQDQLVERLDPRGIPYFWIGGPPPSGLAVPGTDFHAVVHRRIAITPIHLDLTGRSLLRRLKTWSWPLEGAALGDAAVDPSETIDSGTRTAAASEAAEEQIADEESTDRR